MQGAHFGTPARRRPSAERRDQARIEQGMPADAGHSVVAESGHPLDYGALRALAGTQSRAMRGPSGNAGVDRRDDPIVRFQLCGEPDG
jgi:hypothetical protein